MKSQLVSTLHHSFVRFLPSLQPTMHPPRQSPSKPPIHQPTHPHIYLHFYLSIHAPILESAFIPTFVTDVAVGDPQLQREPSYSFGRVTFTWYSLYIFVARKPTTVSRQCVAPSIVSHITVESKLYDEEHGTFQLYGPLHHTPVYGCNNDTSVLALISIICLVSLI
jgi:hypothetical protein